MRRQDDDSVRIISVAVAAKGAIIVANWTLCIRIVSLGRLSSQRGRILWWPKCTTGMIHIPINILIAVAAEGANIVQTAVNWALCIRIIYLGRLSSQRRRRYWRPKHNTGMIHRIVELSSLNSRAHYNGSNNTSAWNFCWELLRIVFAMQSFSRIRNLHPGVWSAECPIFFCS